MEWARGLPGAGEAVREALRVLDDLGEAHARSENDLREAEAEVSRMSRIHEAAEEELRAAENALEAQLRARWSKAEIAAAKRKKV